jgi:hypothetical protein
MRYRPPLITLLLLLTASLAFACSDDAGDDPNATQPDGLVGDTLTVSRTGDGVSGAFVTDGVFDVRVVGDDVTVDNSRLFVFQLTPQENGSRTAIVTGSGPKAVAEGVTQRPGPLLDLTFDIGQGEYYVLLKTDSESVWTMTIKGVSGG